jgi:hypothetical protein
MILVVLEDRVDVVRFVGDVVQAGLRDCARRTDVVVDIVVAAVETAEGADHVVLVAGIDVVRSGSCPASRGTTRRSP